MKPLGLIIGALGGLLVTVIITLAWPKHKARFARPLVAPLVGILIAYILMRLV